MRTVAVDKTGTLTRGGPRLAEIVTLDGAAEDAALALRRRGRAALRAPARRRRSSRAARERGLRRRRAGRRSRRFPGRGAEATRRGPRAVGRRPASRRRAARRACPARPASSRRAGGRRSCSARATARSRCSGSPTSRAPRRPRAVDGAARAPACERVVMLTGDNAPRRRVRSPRSVGVDEWRAGLLPEEKLRAVRDARGATAARWRWSATASTTRPRWPPRASASRWARPAPTWRLESADVALMSDDLRALPDAVGRRARRAAGHASERHRVAGRQGGVRRARPARPASRSSSPSPPTWACRCW